MKVDELIFDQDLLNLYHYMSSVRPSLLAHGNYAVFVHRRNRLVVMMLYDIYIYIYIYIYAARNRDSWQKLLKKALAQKWLLCQ